MYSLSKIYPIFCFLFFLQTVTLQSVENSEDNNYSDTSNKQETLSDTNSPIMPFEKDDIENPTESQIEMMPSADKELLKSANEKILNERSKTMLYQTRALENSTFLLKKNFNDINSLEIAIVNYGNDHLRSRLISSYETYKRATKLFYTKKILFAEKELNNNKEEIAALYADILKLYLKEIEILLDTSVDKLIVAQLFLAKNGANGNLTKFSLIEAKEILESAYRYLDLARNQEKAKLYGQSLIYYRLAKVYSINVLVHLVQNKNEKMNVKKKYSKEILDANRVLTGTSFLASIQNY